MRKTLGGIVALAVVYTAIARLGLSLDAVSGFATLVWPPTGIALAALVLFGPRLWPGVFVGALAVNVWVGAPLAVALGIAAGNTAEAVLGAALLRRLTGSARSFDSLRHVIGLVVGAALVSPLVSATVGVLSLTAGGVIHSTQQQFETWRAWWVGDVLGDLVVAPCLLTWLSKPIHLERSARRVLEAVALAVVLGLASFAIFFRPAAPIYPIQSPYVLFPVFVWAALRFQLRGATLVTAGVSIVAIWGTANGTGPFARDELASGLLALQTFMGCAAITSLVVGAVTMDRARALQANDTFMATLSHDLKTPLQALSLSGDTLRLAVSEAAVSKHLGVLTLSVDRMTRLITDLLDAAALERGRLVLHRASHDLRGVVDEAVELLTPVASARQVAFAVVSDERPQVWCDRERILQVLSNVLGNAIKFAPAATTVKVEFEPVALGVRVAIHDSGPGIPRGALGLIFERGWHADKSAGGGSGLGLFIAKGIVEAHGGEIWVDCQPGSGTSFYFTVPTGADWPHRRVAHDGSRSTSALAP